MIRRRAAWLVWVCALGAAVAAAAVAGSSNAGSAENAAPAPWNDTWTDKLKQSLLAEYDKFARPSQHWNATTVSVKLNVQTVEVDDMLNVMAANVWLVMTWNDEKLKWNSAEYSGLKSVKLAAHEIWLPDVYLLNSAAHGMEYYGDRHCVVSEQGLVLWVTPTVFHGYCHLDFALWPFESNTCRLSLSSWTYDGAQLDLRLLASGLDLDDYAAVGEWVLENATASRREESFDCCPEPYVTLDFEFELARAAELYYHVVFVPAAPIVCLSLAGFWLRPRTELRLLVNACVVLVVLLYLVYFGYKVPPRFDSLPLIVRFYSGCLYPATASLVVAALLVNLHKLSDYASLPRPLRRLLLGRAGRCLGLGHAIREVEAARGSSEAQLLGISLSSGPFEGPRPRPLSSAGARSPVASLEWTLAAAAIDRLLFLLFCLVFLGLAVCCLRLRRFSFAGGSLPYWHA